MTEAEAWREIARAFAEREDAGLALAGLCWAAEGLAQIGHISFEDASDMEARVQGYMNHAGFAYHTDLSTFDNAFEHEARCLAALWLAEEAEHE